MSASIVVLDRGHRVEFSYEDLLRAHAGNSPAGVAHAFKVMERGFADLEDGSPLERGEIRISTAFGGPGARDAFEAVTGAVSDGRYVVEPALARPELGMAMERFVFRISYRGRAVTLVVRPGFVTEEFISLARKERSTAEDARLDVLKAEMASRVTAHAAHEVYEEG